MEANLQYVVEVFKAASLIAGTAVLKEAAEDMYTKLRDSLTKKASPTNVEALEDNLDDDSKQRRLVQILADKVDEADAKALVELAKSLSQALETHHAETYRNFEWDLKRAKVKNVNITDSEIEIAGSARVDASDSEINGDFTFSNMTIKQK